MGLEHLQALFGADNSEPIQEPKKEVKEQYSPILTAHIQRDNKARELYFKMADNINKSEKLRVEITKGIKRNDPIDELFIAALKCISLMTGDEVFYNQNISNLEGRG